MKCKKILIFEYKYKYQNQHSIKYLTYIALIFMTSIYLFVKCILCTKYFISIWNTFQYKILVCRWNSVCFAILSLIYDFYDTSNKEITNCTQLGF